MTLKSFPGARTLCEQLPSSSELNAVLQRTGQMVVRPVGLRSDRKHLTNILVSTDQRQCVCNAISLATPSRIPVGRRAEERMSDQQMANPISTHLTVIDYASRIVSLVSMW